MSYKPPSLQKKESNQRKNPSLPPTILLTVNSNHCINDELGTAQAWHLYNGYTMAMQFCQSYAMVYNKYNGVQRYAR